MKSYSENYIKQLQRLLTIVNDGKEGYLKAAADIESPSLKEKFTNFSNDRKEIANELEAKITEMGGTATNRDGDTIGLMHRSWLSIKTALTKHDEQAVLETCRNGDQASLDVYDDILQGTILESDLKPFIMHQRLKINEAFMELDKLYFYLFSKSNEF